MTLPVSNWRQATRQAARRKGLRSWRSFRATLAWCQTIRRSAAPMAARSAPGRLSRDVDAPENLVAYYE